MARLSSTWTETNMSWERFFGTTPILIAFGWSFFEHPDFGDEETILAMSLDHIGDNGPIVYNTNEYDVPEYL